MNKLTMLFRGDHDVDYELIHHYVKVTGCLGFFAREVTGLLIKNGRIVKNKKSGTWRCYSTCELKGQRFMLGIDRVSRGNVAVNIKRFSKLNYGNSNWKAFVVDKMKKLLRCSH